MDCLTKLKWARSGIDGKISVRRTASWGYSNFQVLPGVVI
jgi:hypothetical protein